MSDNTVIRVGGLTKVYRIWDRPASRLWSPLLEAIARCFPDSSSAAQQLKRRARSHWREFAALKNVSFEMRRGESLGIVGRNGSGKSTLLQLIAGTLQPSHGTVQVFGRVAALLELGSGFNPEFTGRENVVMNASVLGLNRAQIDQRMDAIVTYAEIGDFIDEPVKIYSSGMQMRLAFAVAVHVDAEILIIDEALGVGDARFQLKCARTIDDFIHKGKTLLFVSHDSSSLKRLCNRALLLENGILLIGGKPNMVVNFYSSVLANPRPIEELIEQAQKLELEGSGRDSNAVTESPTNEQLPELVARPADNDDTTAVSRQLQEAHKAIARLSLDDRQLRRLHQLNPGNGIEVADADEYSYGGILGRILSPLISGRGTTEASVFITGDPMQVSFLAQAEQDIDEPLYALTVKSANGQDIYCTNTLFLGMTIPPLSAGHRSQVTFDLTLNLLAGEYFLSLGWVTFRGENIHVIHRRYDVMKFTVLPIDRRVGIANLHSKITVKPLDQPQELTNP